MFTELLKELLFHRGSTVVILSLFFSTSLTFKDSFNIIIIELQKRRVLNLYWFCMCAYTQKDGISKPFLNVFSSIVNNAECVLLMPVFEYRRKNVTLHHKVQKNLNMYLPSICFYGSQTMMPRSKFGRFDYTISEWRTSVLKVNVFFGKARLTKIER